MKLAKTMIKKWFLLPLIIFLCLLIPRLLMFIYISPTGMRDNETKLLKSHSFSLKITCKFIPGYTAVNEYFITSEPKGLLDEIYISGTDYMFAPVGLVFGNFDYDKEKELLVICQGGPTKSILGLVDNIKQYYYKGSSEFVGYYDFQGNKFEFKHIDKSPFFWLIKDWYINEGWFSSSSIVLYGVLAVLLTGIFALLNLLITKVHRYFRKKKEV